MEREESVAGSLSANEMLRTGRGTKAAWVEPAGLGTRSAFARVKEGPILGGEVLVQPVVVEVKELHGSSSVDLLRPSRFPPAKRAALTASHGQSSSGAEQVLWYVLERSRWRGVRPCLRDEGCGGLPSSRRADPPRSDRSLPAPSHQVHPGRVIRLLPGRPCQVRGEKSLQSVEPSR